MAGETVTLKIKKQLDREPHLPPWGHLAHLGQEAPLCLYARLCVLNLTEPSLTPMGGYLGKLKRHDSERGGSEWPKVTQLVWGSLGLNPVPHHLLLLKTAVPCVLLGFPLTLSPCIGREATMCSGRSLSFRVFLLIWAPLLLTL